MKKIVAILMSLVMLFAASAIAEDVTAVYFDEANIAEISGEFLTLEDLGVQVYIPDVFVAQELTDEAIAAGSIGLLTTQDGAYNMSIDFVAVTDAEGNAIEDYDTLVALYEEAGASDIEIIDLNGWYAMSYILPEYDTMSVMYLYDGGYVLNFGFSPISDESYAALVTVIASTIMPIA